MNFIFSMDELFISFFFLMYEVPGSFPVDLGDIIIWELLNDESQSIEQPEIFTRKLQNMCSLIEIEL